MSAPSNVPDRSTRWRRSSDDDPSYALGSVVVLVMCLYFRMDGMHEPCTGRSRRRLRDSFAGTRLLDPNSFVSSPSSRCSRGHGGGIRSRALPHVVVVIQPRGWPGGFPGANHGEGEQLW